MLKGVIIDEASLERVADLEDDSMDEDVLYAEPFNKTCIVSTQPYCWSSRCTVLNPKSNKERVVQAHDQIIIFDKVYILQKWTEIKHPLAKNSVNLANKKNTH